jgi:hypothetical protein
MGRKESLTTLNPFFFTEIIELEIYKLFAIIRPNNLNVFLSMIFHKTFEDLELMKHFDFDFRK